MGKSSGSNRFKPTTLAIGRKGNRKEITTMQLRSMIKDTIIKNKGTFTGYDFTKFTDRYFISNARSKGFNTIVTQVQNQVSYFRFSPSQAEFRKKYNFR